MTGAVWHDAALAQGWLSDGGCPSAPSERLRHVLIRDPPDILLIGEVHDNALHHGYRAQWPRDILNASQLPLPQGIRKKPALVFEHIRPDQQHALAGHPATTADLFRRLDWDKSGWPDQKIFEPLFAAVLAGSFPILPGDPPRGRTREVARRGLDVLSADERAQLRLDEPFPQPLADALAAEIKVSHCGLLPDSAIPGLALAQRYRDAHLADAALRAAEMHGSAILLAGNGHVRSDRGVPWHIRLRAPDKKVVSVLLIEVEDGKTDPEAYAPRGPDGAPAADYVLFTPRAERPDPCEEMRRSYGK